MSDTIIPSLEYVTRMVESENRQNAIRFEPVSFQEKPLWIARQVPVIQKYNPGISYDTGLMLGCTSWGYYQILAANIYALGFKGDIIEFCSDKQMQLSIFNSFCRQDGFTCDELVTTWGPARFLQWAVHQNGTGNTTNYIAQMKKVLK